MKKMILYFQKLKLQSKIRVTYMIVCTIPILIIGVFAYVQSSRLVLQTESSKLTNTLLQSKSTLENKIHIYENFGDYIAFNETVYQVINYPYSNYYEMYEKFTNIIDPLLLSIRYLDHGIAQITIYTDNVKESHDTIISPLKRLEEEGWYEELKQSLEPLWFVSDNKEAFYARRMMQKTNTDARSVLYVRFMYETLFQSMENIPEENIGILITDRGGTVIYERNNFSTAYQKFAIHDSIKLLDSSERNSLGNYIQSVQNVVSAGFTIYLYKPLKAIPRYADRILLTVGVVVLLSMFIMYGVGAGASYLIVKPIKELTSNMAEVAGGRMEVHITSDSEDEVGIMIQSFGKMVNQISALINENYKSKISLKEFEMKALQAQINPHFLYNSLSLINWKALRAGEEDISKISLLLSSFYRTTLNKGNSLTLVKDEIKNIESYLEIQLFMHDNSFLVVKDISEDILTEKMPNLTLQPIVENAIHHGIELKEEEVGVLTIRGYMENGHILLQIEDNGVGMDEDTCKTLLSLKTSGYGVKNVNDRIRLLYGEKYNLQIQSVLGKGTKVTVKIPMNVPSALINGTNG